MSSSQCTASGKSALCCLAHDPLHAAHQAAHNKHGLAQRILCCAPDRHRHGRSSASTHAGRRRSPRTTSVPAKVMRSASPGLCPRFTSNGRLLGLVWCVCKLVARP